MNFLRCEKMIETIVVAGELQNEPLTEEVRAILWETMKKIRYIDDRILPSEFMSDEKERN